MVKSVRRQPWVRHQHVMVLASCSGTGTGHLVFGEVRETARSKKAEQEASVTTVENNRLSLQTKVMNEAPS